MNQPEIAFTNACLDSITAADFETLAGLSEENWRAHYSKISASAQID